MSATNSDTTYSKRKAIHHLILLSGIGVGVRVLAALILGTGFSPETWEYESIALNLLERDTFVTVYRDYGEYFALDAPGYPLLLFSIYKLFGVNHSLALLVQLFLTCLFLGSIYLISYSLFADQETSLYAGLIAATHPGIATYGATKLHSFNLYLPLFYLALLMMLRCSKTCKKLDFVALGTVSGLAVLARVTFLPVLTGWILLFLTDRNMIINLKGRVKLTVLALGVVVAINLPWAARNYLHFDRIVVSQTNSWECLWVGNNPNSSGTNYTTDGQVVLHLKPAPMRAELLNSSSEIQDARIFKKYTLIYIKDQPLRFLLQLGSKAWRFWWFYPQTGISYPGYALKFYQIFYVVVLALAAIGARECARRGLWSRALLYPLSLATLIWLAHTLAYGEMRHRWAVEPVLLLFSGLGLPSLRHRFLPYHKSHR